ncbi:hypothetical protein H4R34_003495 [Dimargaris verticillata]|uniref:RRM domain-containing protein n=1 Tax=Dimargaris verticillata TaxID=2761393 RepID=A0A9W8ED37_9FUNG|nr:hypothetical protein H4R34_003495 [Dimargaris verticillata]
MSDNVEFDINPAAGDDVPEPTAMAVDTITKPETESPAVTKKGRGFRPKEGTNSPARVDRVVEEDQAENRYQKSVEGWVIMVTGIHEEATEDDVVDRFADFGPVKDIHLNLDRRTGYVKGYALIEYETKAQAQTAVQEASGTELLGKPLHCECAFIKGDSASTTEVTHRPRR